MLIFYTAGILTKQELVRSNPSYVPYGDRLGIFQRVQGWSEDEAVFGVAWKPYLEGKKKREEATGCRENDLLQEMRRRASELPKPQEGITIKK